MKKNISKTIVTIAIVTAFLMPLMGNTALATTTTFYFNHHDNSEKWETYPELMVDGSLCYFASTDEGEVQLLDRNTCNLDSGSISKVEIRVCGYYSGDSSALISLRPVFDGSTDGNDHAFTTIDTTPRWSSWFDITDDNNAPDHWTWTDVTNLDCDVVASGSGSFTLYGAKVEMQVTYT